MFLAGAALQRSFLASYRFSPKGIIGYRSSASRERRPRALPGMRVRSAHTRSLTHRESVTCATGFQLSRGSRRSKQAGLHSAIGDNKDEGDARNPRAAPRHFQGLGVQYPPSRCFPDRATHGHASRPDHVARARSPEAIHVFNRLSTRYWSTAKTPPKETHSSRST